MKNLSELDCLKKSITDIAPWISASLHERSCDEYRMAAEEILRLSALFDEERKAGRSLVEIRCRGCNFGVTLPFTDDSQTSVSTEHLNGWVFPPGLCRSCAARVRETRGIGE